jgi:hypothetical protein
MSGRSRHVWRWRQGLVREEVRSPAVHKMDVDGDEAVDKVHVQALIDTGCLVGDCMSQKIVDSLRASHLIVNIKTTSSSSFDNQCLSDFLSLLINIMFINEKTFIQEFFQTRVLMLPNSPIDLIIGRKQLKQLIL